MLQNFTYNSAKIYYSDIGDGSTILFIHGFGEDITVWNEQVNFLKNNYRVITLNLPGTNNSELLIKLNVKIEDYAECVYSLLQFLNLANANSVAIFGHSMGGYIALEFAKKYQHCVSKLGLINSTAFADTEEKKQIRQRGIETIETYGAYEFLKTTIPNLFADNFKQTNKNVVENLIEKSRLFSKQALQQYYYAMMQRSDNTQVLVNIIAPVLFIIGTQDKAVLLTDALQQTHLPKIAQVKILDNVAHMSMIEQSEIVNTQIESFMTL